MDHESLRTAATYLNNLLLARGLLRNGEPIDFVKPSKDSRAQIINLVHDLILRQDRDREQLEHMAVTLRTLRAEETRRNADIERLSAKCEESARQSAAAQSAERAAVAEVKKIERTMRTLQEQTSKLKTQLAQVKTQCTNDLRKRDLELSRLKTHLQGQQRGNKGGPIAPSMTIVGASGNGRRAVACDVADPEYSLKQETTEFLTELSQSLSDENDSLISLIRSSLSTMRDLLGLPANFTQHDSAIGSMASNEEGKLAGGQMLQALPTSYEIFSSELDATLASLKAVLTNPNFVTMEEVEVRDEEIARLRDGWEKMEQRWRDVLLMMQGWLRRMDTGDTINIDELRRGMGLVSPVRELQSLRTRRSTDVQDVDSSLLTSNEDDMSGMQLPTVTEESSLIQEEPELVQRRNSPKRKRALMDPPDFFDLRPKSANATSEGRSLPRDLEMGSDAGESDEETPETSPGKDGPRMTVAEKLALAQTEADEAAAAARSNEKKPSSASSKRIPARNSADHSASPQKRSAISNLNGSAEEDAFPEGNISRMTEKQEGVDTLGAMVPGFSPVAKRTKIRGRPRKKRKSTLSPEELEDLIGAANDEDNL